MENGAAGPNGVRAQKPVEGTENVRGIGNVTALLQRMEEEIA